ncbi:MAG: SRPBCC family protein [Nitrolancea sp.]
MSTYSFLSVWELEAPIDDVWEVIHQANSYAEWFPYISQSSQLGPGDAVGVGATSRSVWRSALPYGFVIDTRAVRVERPHLLELAASGGLEGTGRWELSTDGPITRVEYHWNVRTTAQWMDLVAPLAGPAFAWNHGVIMRAGGEGLARRLDAHLVRNQSFTEEPTSPAGAALAVAGMFALTILLVSLVRRIRAN